MITQLNTTTHKLILYPATKIDPAYFSLTDKRRIVYVTPQPLTEAHKLEVKPSVTGPTTDTDSITTEPNNTTQTGQTAQNDKFEPVNIFLSRQPIGSINDESYYREALKFVEKWQWEVSLLTESPPAGFQPSARRVSVEDIRKNDLQSHKDKVIRRKKLLVRVVTWNTHGADLTKEDLTLLLTGREKENDKDNEHHGSTDGQITRESPGSYEDKSKDSQEAHNEENQGPDVKRSKSKWQSTPKSRSNSKQRYRDSRDTKNRLPDLVVICLQEADSLSRNVYSSATINNVSAKVLDTLNQHAGSNHDEYVIADTNQLLSLHLLVVCTKEVNEQLTIKSKSSTGTGLFGVLGNKGACGISLVIGHEKEIADSGTELILVDSHLAAGEDDESLERRKWDLSEIGKHFGFAVPQHSHSRSFDSDAAEVSLEELSIESKTRHDDNNDDDEGPRTIELVAAVGDNTKPVLIGKNGKNDKTTPAYTGASPISGQFTPVSPSIPETPVNQQQQQTLGRDLAAVDADHIDKVWILAGDLNFRIHMNKELLKDFLSMKDYQTLAVEDTLSIQRKEHKILQGFVEGELQFAPTYRYSNDGKLDYQRTPSYCDRILYKQSLAVRGHSIVEQHDYGSIPSYIISDHKPVFACYSIDVSWVDFKERTSIVAEALKEHDHMENSLRPDVQLDSLEISGPPDAVVLKEQEAFLVLTNPETSACLSHWEINCSNPEIKVEPKSGVLPVGAVQKIAVKYTMGLEEAGSEVNDILVLKILNVKDIFVTVKFAALKSCLATPLDVLCRAVHGVRRNLVAQDSPAQFEIPKPFLECVRYLDQHDCRNIFTNVRHPQRFTFNTGGDAKANVTLLALCQQIQSWMDDASNFDYEVLHEANRYEKNIGTLAVAQQLLIFVYYVPGKLISEDLYEDVLHTSAATGAANLWAKIDLVKGKCLSLLCEFLHNVIVNKRHESRRVIIDVFEPLLFAVPSKFHDNKSMFTLREERNSRRTLLTELIMKTLIS